LERLLPVQRRNERDKAKLSRNIKTKIAETTIQKPQGGYWETLQKHGIPNYLLLGGELVIITGQEKRKRKKGGKIDQVYFHTEDGRCHHASYFIKVDLKTILRDHKLSQLGL
jgi:hypothetical protein